MSNRYELTTEVKNEYFTKVVHAIEKIENSNECIKISFADTKLNPYTLSQLLVDLGYEEGEIEINGWEMDFWITFTKDGCKTLSLNGTGITFDMYLIAVQSRRTKM